MSRVLVVDDDASIREMTELALRAAGHEVVSAATGPEALERLARTPADAILLDLRMPLMDGAEFAREYRARVSRAAPIIVITAARNAAVTHGEVGATHYLEKPFDLDVLLQAVDEVTSSTAS